MCVPAARKALEKVKGVKSVQVLLERRKATVVADETVQDADLIKAIEGVSYKAEVVPQAAPAVQVEAEATGAEATAVSKYLPLAVGNRWVYELSDRTDAPSVVESWEVNRSEDGAFVLHIYQSELSTGGFEEFLLPTTGGIKRFYRETGPEEATFLLKAPLRVGERWSDEDGTYEITAVQKTVSLPAGTFSDCLEVTYRSKESNATVVTLYAPGVGVVQREETYAAIEVGVGPNFNPKLNSKASLLLSKWTVK